MQEPTNSPGGQRVPFKQEGWGVAAFVVLLAVAAAAGAAYVHNATYKHPTDVRFHAAGTATAAAHE
ncbi:MAG: hypothetical protein ABJE47_00840 [bacterium]